jgi:hypothetical protein
VFGLKLYPIMRNVANPTLTTWMKKKLSFGFAVKKQTRPIGVDAQKNKRGSKQATPPLFLLIYLFVYPIFLLSSWF